MNLALQVLWEKIVALLKESYSKKASFKMFLGSVSPLKIEDGNFVLEVINDFCKRMGEREYSKPIIEILQAETPSLNLVFVIKAKEKRAGNPVQSKMPIAQEEGMGNPVKTVNTKRDKMFKDKYNFDSFVVGKSNQFAYAVCQSVTKNLGKLHNPVFIYGGVGLGKTHLMQAIGHEVLNANPKTRVAYLSSETFTNEFIDSLKDKKSEAFRTKYRKTDLLLIDDVQFFAGKEQTQEEFFHTFNELFNQGKQIILTSDAPPDKISKLEERLASRFSMGVVIDIQLPDLELRAAILKKIADKSRAVVSDEAIMYLAQGVPSNIRMLEGALNSVLAYAGVMQKPVSKDLIDQVLKNILRDIASGKINIKWIQERVSEFYDISEEEIRGKRRSKNLVLPRQIAMRLAQIFTDSSLSRIGDHFGGRDHTTVIHACDKINKKIIADQAFSDEFERVKRFVDPSKQ